MPVEVVGAQRASWRARVVSAGEWTLGALVVVGHNVFRVVPNEVPILVVLAIVSMRLREGAWRWAALGFKRPESWSRIVLIALPCEGSRRFSSRGLAAVLVQPLYANLLIRCAAGTGTRRSELSTATGVRAALDLASLKRGS